MRVLVCGSRRIWVDEMELDREIDLVEAYLWGDKGSPTLDVIIHGGCSEGADAAAARIRNCPIEVFEADWETHGKAAGPIRNQAMIDSKPDAVLAYWDGESKGTLDTIRRAAKAGIPVFIAVAGRHG